MPRRVLLAAALIGAFLVGSLVAPVRTLIGEPLAADGPCESDGIAVDYTTEFRESPTPAYRVTSVEVRGISSDCVGQPMRVELLDDGERLAQSPIEKIDGTSMSFRVNPFPLAEQVTRVHAEIGAPAAEPTPAPTVSVTPSPSVSVSPSPSPTTASPGGGGPVPTPSPTATPLPTVTPSPEVAPTVAPTEPAQVVSAGWCRGWVVGSVQVNDDAAQVDLVVVGTPSIDQLLGGSGDDVICGLDAADQLEGGDGSDRLTGGREPDVLRGGRGSDLLRGGDGHDVLEGGYGRDALRGGTGDDHTLGGPGRDLLSGGGGQDVLRGGKGADVLRGGAGVDHCIVQGHDRVRGCERVRGEERRVRWGPRSLWRLSS